MGAARRSIVDRFALEEAWVKPRVSRAVANFLSNAETREKARSGIAWFRTSRRTAETGRGETKTTSVKSSSAVGLPARRTLASVEVRGA